MLQGSLKETQLPEVLQFISMNKTSGTLTLRRENTEITLMIMDGRIINSSSLERQRRLGDLLVYRGIIKRSELAQILNLQRTVESDKRLGQILVERDIVSESTIRDVLRLQLEEEIWNLFGWEDGEFRFDAAEKSKLGDAIVQIDIEPLLLEGTRRHDEWRKIVRALPSDKVVPRIKPLADEFEAPPKLSPAEWRVLAQINGIFNIRAVINRSGMGRFEVYRILHEFLNKGLITIERLEGEEVPEVVREEAAEEQEAIQAGRKRVTGLFSLLTGAARAEQTTQQLRFLTPIGLMAHFINSFVDQAMEMREFKQQPSDKNLVERAWYDLMMSFTKADLIRAEGNKLNPTTLEAFFDNFEFGDQIRDCYEDAIEALFQLLDIVYRIIAQRVGERNAVRVVRELLTDFSPRVSLKYETNFKLEERVQMVLRLAA